MIPFQQYALSATLLSGSLTQFAIQTKQYEKEAFLIEFPSLDLQVGNFPNQGRMQNFTGDHDVDHREHIN